MIRHLLAAALLTLPLAAEEPISLSGIYPHLAMFNNERECGTGAVVPFADRLWVVTYAPHSPSGSSDKLYEISPDHTQTIRPESIGGTPANRMIHPESNQLFIGPYAIDFNRKVRPIPYSEMFGRPTANARHLTDPAGKIYYATMEEGLYEVNVKTLAVTELFRDEAQKGEAPRMDLPGYHGKGLYSSQGLLVYANNGEHGPETRTNPATPSGALATWDGKAEKFTLVRRNQFTEVTGPGGITGQQPADAPLWSIGWDHRSLILAVLHENTWTYYRLPKGSHSYDGAHGWNTEWPRIREIGEGENLLMTMHGTFWKFPKTFSPKNSAGIRPRSNYLKVIGDFARWQDRLVFGCDDTAASEFINKRRAKGEIAAPQSQSNLWFLDPEKLDHLGPVIGRGSVWIEEDVKKDTHSDPYLFAGYDHRTLVLSHQSETPVTFLMEYDEEGNNIWTPSEIIVVPPGETKVLFTDLDAVEWIRLTPTSDAKSVTATFLYRNNDPRENDPDPIFQGLAQHGDPTVTGGNIRARAENTRTLAFSAVTPSGEDLGYYELDGDLKLLKVDDEKAHKFNREKAAIPDSKNFLTHDAASVIYLDEKDRRWRLPKSSADFDQGGFFGTYRIAREVATERDMFSAYGTFYELPSNNGGGFPLLRPIATHNRQIHDFASYRGLLILSGTDLNSYTHNPHMIRSDDGKTALWAGAVDDLWKFGKPRGQGGPWLKTEVKKDSPSDPYLMTGYDKKSLLLSATTDTQITAQIDPTGTGQWLPYKTFALKKGEPQTHNFPEAFSAYWIRFTSSQPTTVTAQLTYE